MENKMIEWINEQLRRREWSIRQLAQKANLSHTQISNVLSGKRNITRDFCVAIAKGFGERPEKVLRMASLLPPEPNPASGENDILNVYRQLSASRRDFLLDAVKGLQGIPTSSDQIVIIDNDGLAPIEANILYLFRGIPPHLQEIALNILRILSKTPADIKPTLIPSHKKEKIGRSASDYPTIEQLTELLKKLSYPARERLVKICLGIEQVDLVQLRRALAEMDQASKELLEVQKEVDPDELE